MHGRSASPIFASDDLRRPAAAARARVRGAAMLALGLVATTPAWAGSTERVSVGPGGRQANDESVAFSPAVSADGRFVAFESLATNLVPGDSNAAFDVFVRDRQTGTTERVSVATDGAQVNKDNFGPSISADGRYVAFTSAAAGLVPGDTNGHDDVFVRDRQTGRTSRVSVRSGGGEFRGASADASISADGVLLHDRRTGKTARIGGGPGGSAVDLGVGTELSARGRHVAYSSRAADLVAGDTNGREDVFVRDRGTGATTRVSVGQGGTQADDDSTYVSISSGGRFVAFMSFATNLVPGDTNGMIDVFVHDRQTGRTERVSVGPGGVQGDDNSAHPSISDDGRYVAFASGASNLVPGDTNGEEDVFVHDRRTNRTSRVSVGTDGVQANGDAYFPAISGDGRHVAFSTGARNLAPGDTNGKEDVYVRSR